MLFAVGWFVVQVLRSGDAAEAPSDASDELHNLQDEALWDALEQQLQQVAATDPFVQWHWQRRFNNARGILQLFASRNHRACAIWHLLDWLAQSSKGNYGLLHVHDDEDLCDRGGTPANDDGHERSNSFRVWRLARGTVSEHADTLLSPIVPAVADAR